ncbi:MAG: GGDEF domain-containing protein [Bacillus sp. (in: Bacteria)]|nr:GGDEF domain-containing protein [Bacillus sp. (in: firmicutes)]
MFGSKAFTPRLNSETFLFFTLLGLTLFSSIFNVTFIYGITFTFTSIFTFLVFRLFGLPLAILASLLTFLFIPFDNNFVTYNIILLVEIIFVGTYFYIKKRAKMFFVDAFFWLTIGLVAIFFFYKSSLVGDALYFQICKDILNGLFNVLIADMLLAYFPFYKLLKSIRINKHNVSVHQFLTHITIISIMIPFFLSVLTKTWNDQEYIYNQAKIKAKNSVNQISKEILLLNKNDPLNFSLNESQKKMKLDDLVEQYKAPDFNIIITNDQDKVITSSSSTEEYYNWDDIYQVKKISNNFYEALPKGQNDILPLIKWRLGKLVFINEINSLSMSIFIQFPISQYQDQMFKGFLIHLSLSILFSLFTIIFVLVVSRMFMNNLKQLTDVTTGLPQKLVKQEKIDWPQSYISELRLLTQNLKEMAQKLKELFQESIEMNRLLTDQTIKLKESEDKLHQLAYHDVLTSLPNRLHFQNYVRNVINNSQFQHIAIIFIDLNQFKQINDTLGHDAGDTLLQLTANKLNTLHDNNREVFRLGGDEFVIVHEIDHREEISNSLEQIRSEFSSPFNINGQELFITVSVGISLFPDDGSDLDSLLKCADLAMYVSKGKGGKTAHFYNESMRGGFSTV